MGAGDPRAATDEELVAGVTAGDRGAFDELVDRYADRVYGICYRYFRDADDAEDAAQETFVVVMRRADTFRGQAKFSTWLYRVATNVCNDLARKRSRRPATVPLEDRHAGPDPEVEDALSRRELNDELRRALAELDDEQREAVVLHDVLGWPQRDIAERAGVAVGTVKSRVHRGHARLAQLLTDRSADEVEPSTDSRPPTGR
ncbi:RNA polymerase sigma factor [Egibacter rhizosphaerae]|nr:sigma-70 family RNA polymerase sigma factor [Egibacter rhizosphaerae]